MPLGVFAAVFLASPAGAFLSLNAPPDAAALTIAHRLQDLDFLVAELPGRHINAFHTVTRERWDAAAADLRRGLADLSEDQFRVEMARLGAMIGDAHTVVFDPDMSRRAVLPFGVQALESGYFVWAATSDAAEVVGSRIIRIDQTPIDAAAAALAAIIPHENEHWLKVQTAGLLNRADVLAGLGVADSRDSVAVTFARPAGGSERTLTLSPVKVGTRFSAMAPDILSSRTPISIRARAQKYGHEFIPIPPNPADAPGSGDAIARRAMYIWYDACTNQPGQATVAEWADALLKAIDDADPPIDRVIIDLRRNSGGDSRLLDPFIRALAARRGKLPGGVFVLIGAHTFSSAQLNAASLQRQAGAILVGQPTGQSPNTYGEVRTFTLPSSKLIVQYCTKRFGNPGDPAAATTLAPEIAVPLTAADFFAGRDAALDAALAAESR